MWNENTKKPIWSFLALAFLISWVCEAILIILEQTGMISGIAGYIFSLLYRGITVASAPTYAVLILLIKHKQINGVKDFFLRIFKVEYILKTVLVTAAFFLFQVIITLLLGQYLGNYWVFTLLMLFAGIIGGGMEEPGWRGFLQPALEEKLPFVVATLCVGLIWSVWHLPAWFVQSLNHSSMNFISFTLYCIVLSFVMATLYRLTKSVFACVLFHSWVNAIGMTIALDNLFHSPDIKVIAISAIQIIAATIICIFVGKKKKSSYS